MRGTALFIITAALSCVATARDLPTFDQFRVAEIYRGRPANVRLGGHPDAKKFRTVLREGARTGPNFAGHYTVVTFGCGTACQRLMIVDAKSGSVFFPPQTQPNSYFMVTDESPPFQFRVDSELLILTGAPMDKENEGVYYYRWTGQALRQLAYVPRSWQR